MELVKKVKSIGYSLSLATLLLPLSHLANAAEGVTPLQPGATTGSHVGALPPPGLYFGYDVDYEWGKLRNGSGKKAGIDLKASNVSMVMSLVWSTEYKIFGANYAMGIAQPYKIARTKIEGSSNSSHGLMSTTIMPAMLSWDLGDGFHLGSGFAFVFRNGKHDYDYNSSTGLYETGGDNLANRYYTIQPNVALTYFSGDWAFTMNNVLDLNFKNTRTKYRSGNTYYLDLTATKRINKWTVGLLGNWTKQIGDDKVDGKVKAATYGPRGQISSEGRRVEHIMFGPMVGYDFGSFSMSARLLTSVHSENDPRMSFFHIGIAIPL